MWAVLLACGAPPPPAAPPPAAPGHADTWDSLARAVAAGDLAAARIEARDLSLGPAFEDTPEAGAVGAAIGALQRAEDPDEAAFALAAARRACDACHAARGVAPTAP